MSPTPSARAEGKREFDRVTFTDDAIADLHGINNRTAPVLRQIFTALKHLDAGLLHPVPLQDYGKTGDLPDCGKIVVETDGHPDHRIVVRDLGN